MMYTFTVSTRTTDMYHVSSTCGAHVCVEVLFLVRHCLLSRAFVHEKSMNIWYRNCSCNSAGCAFLQAGHLWRVKDFLRTRHSQNNLLFKRHPLLVGAPSHVRIPPYIPFSSCWWVVDVFFVFLCNCDFGDGVFIVLLVC